jgi:hypothetical protein
MKRREKEGKEGVKELMIYYLQVYKEEKEINKFKLSILVV